jgi:hypothetical protein
MSITNPETTSNTPRINITGLACPTLVPSPTRTMHGFSLLLPAQEDLLTQRGRPHPLENLQLAVRLLSTEATRRQRF